MVSIGPPTPSGMPCGPPCPPPPKPPKPSNASAVPSPRDQTPLCDMCSSPAHLVMGNRGICEWCMRFIMAHERPPESDSSDPED